MISYANTVYRTARVHGLKRTSKIATQRMLNKISEPRVINSNGLMKQKRLIHNLFDGTNDPVWLLWLDGARFDYFEKLYPEYFEGRLYKVWNGGQGYTGDWSDYHLRHNFEEYGLFSLADLQSFGEVDYDARDWFGTVPDIELADNTPMHERLAALGYAELESEDVPELEPEKTNQSVREHMDTVNGGVVRYLKPHPPFVGLEQMTAGSSKTRDTMHALATGELTEDELCEAYERTFRAAFEYAQDLAKDLPGKIVVTSDHGECLRCGQLFHGRHHIKHSHLVEVPWLEVDHVQ